MRANKKKSILRDEPSEDSTSPDATEATVPDEEPQEVTQVAGIPITKTVDEGTSADKDSDSEDNLPIRFCVKRRVEEPSASIPKSKQAKLLKEVTTETLVRMGLAEADDAANVNKEGVQRTDQQLPHNRMAESEKKRKSDGDDSPIKVYKKQKTRRTLSTTLDTQEPGTQSVSDIHEAENVESVAAAQGANPDKAANTDEAAFPDITTIPDEGANPDEGITHDGETIHEEEANPDASIAVQEATQEPFTQSVKESQATQEPPTQREGESLTEAGSGNFSNLPLFISRIICENEY